MKKHVIRYILMLAILAVCILIFHFSAQNAQTSGGLSQTITQGVMKNSKKIESVEEEKKQEILEQVEHYIRKAAHFSIYMILGILLVSCAHTFSISKKKQFLISLLLAFVYACSDEFHQIFVPGRMAMATDVAIDTLGALLGITLVLLLVIAYQKWGKKKLEEKKSTKKVMFISSTGGHLNELLQCRPIFEKYEYSLVTERMPTTEDLSKRFPDHVFYLNYGTRKQPFMYLFIFLGNIFKSLYLYFTLQPDAIVTTGTHTAVPMCYIAKLFGTKVIWIETFANETTKTLAGKLVYPIADTFVVQWESMLKLYPKAQYWGWIY